MKKLRSEFDFGLFLDEHKSEIIKTNGDLTLFGGLVFVLYGVALVLAINKLRKKEKKVK